MKITSYVFSEDIFMEVLKRAFENNPSRLEWHKLVQYVKLPFLFCYLGYNKNISHLIIAD